MKYFIKLSSLGLTSFMVILNDSFSVSNLVKMLFWLALASIMISVLSSFFYKMILWFYFSLILMFSFLSSSLMLFFMMFEISLIPILLMILYWGSQPERIYSSFFLLIYTSSFSIPFISILIYLKVSFLIKETLNCSFLVCVMALSPFLVKMPILGVHFWLPKAHVEASTTGSMVLAGVLLKLGSYGLLRILSFVAMAPLNYSSLFWVILSVISSLLTVVQSDLKKMVAYSSVSHMTFLMMGVVFLNYSSLFIFVFLSLAHGWASMGMFFFAGLLSGASFSRLSVLLKSEDKFHWFSLICGLFLMSNMSLPPFPSFFCEIFLISSFLASNLIFLFIILMGVFVCYYNLYIFMLLSHNNSYEMKLGQLMSKSLMNSYSLVFLLVLTNFLFLKF